MNLLKTKLSGKRLLASLLVLTLSAQFLVPSLLPVASAGAMTNTLVKFDRLKAATFTSGTVCAKPSSTATETSVKVTFPTGFVVSSTVGNWTVNNTSNASWPSGATPWVSISAPTGSGEFVISGQSVNFGSGTLTAGTLYCFNWTNNTTALQTPSAANNLTGQVITQTTGGVAADTGNYAASIVTNDQIAVTATVNASFSFSLSSNASALGSLSTASPSAAAAINASVSTNAKSGWQMWAADPAGTPGLTSLTASKTIAYNPAAGASVATLTNGNEGYNLSGGTASGTTCTSVTTDPNFASGGTSYRGGGLDNTLRSLATSTGVANACALPLTINAAISATTPAAIDYAGTITVVAAGNF